ncbi:MAG: hypothetical protein NC225_12250 [Clostridium sp.]|nr:hypothetical protein [Clostridium sp.]MCM1400240.1 hypothetical protein [Clostridium sp.]MCM1460953.1 hypothetical protein [Bacteroides sp.]
MPRQRNQLKSYNISKHRYMELYHYCMQYNEWKEELRDIEDGLRSPSKGQTTSCSSKSDKTATIAIKRAELSAKCKLIEQTAEETDKNLKDYILAAVTRGDTYNYLSTVKGMPCGRRLYYELRRRFYYLLSKKI